MGATADKLLFVALERVCLVCRRTWRHSGLSYSTGLFSNITSNTHFIHFEGRRRQFYHLSANGKTNTLLKAWRRSWRKMGVSIPADGDTPTPVCMAAGCSPDENNKREELEQVIITIKTT